MERVRRHVSDDGRGEHEAGADPEGEGVVDAGFGVFVKLLVTCVNIPTLLTPTKREFMANSTGLYIVALHLGATYAANDALRCSSSGWCGTNRSHKLAQGTALDDD